MNLELAGSAICFGEVLVRLSTEPGTRLSNAGALTVHVGGAEANVAALLAQVGHEAEIISALPNSALGDLCVADLRRHGIGTGELLRKDGRLGLYYYEPQGAGGRVIYDRGHSVFEREADAFDWPEIAARARWFHLSGINLALGETAASAALEAAKSMVEAGVPMSFDVNHRASLWDGRSKSEISRVREVAALADILFASAFDISRLLGTPPPENAAASANEPVRAAFNELGRLQWVASTRRIVEDRGQLLSCRVESRDERFETGPVPLGKIIDRIGSGDAFAGAVIHGILSGRTHQECAILGLAAAVMKHGIAGDRWVGTLEDLETFDPFVARDIQR